MFGCIGKNYNEDILLSLAVENVCRGHAATGFFNSYGEVWKKAIASPRAVREDDFNDFLDGSVGAWFVAGHTRLGTRGANTDENAHPFSYGTYIGSHNGIVSAPQRYAVDSMYLIDSLHKQDGDYQAAFENISGSWALTWYDYQDFYIQSSLIGLSVTKYEGVYYYSSESYHLNKVIGNSKTVKSHRLSDGETFKFSLVEDKIEVKQLEDLKLPKRNYYYSNWGD